MKGAEEATSAHVAVAQQSDSRGCAGAKGQGAADERGVRASGVDERGVGTSGFSNDLVERGTIDCASGADDMGSWYEKWRSVSLPFGKAQVSRSFRIKHSA